MSVLKSIFSDPTIIVVLLANAIVAWSLIATLHSTHPIARLLTYFAFLPLIGFLVWADYLKIETDSVIQQKQADIISALDSRSNEISARLEKADAQLRDVENSISKLTPQLADLASSTTETLSNVKSGTKQTMTQLETMLEWQAKIEKCKDYERNHQPITITTEDSYWSGSGTPPCDFRLPGKARR